MRTVKAAAVQIRPVLDSREGTVDKVVRQIFLGKSSKSEINPALHVIKKCNCPGWLVSASLP